MTIAKNRNDTSFTWDTPDVLNIALGVIMLLAPLWMPDPQPLWQVPLGIATIAVALWAVFTRSNTGVEKVMIGIGVLTFVSPFLGLYGNLLATWHAWLSGFLTFAVALRAIGVASRR